MTISCAWAYLLERASSASQKRHMSCAPLKTSESWSWGSMRVSGGLSVDWIAKTWKWRLKRPALLIADRRTFMYQKILLGEDNVAWSKSITCLGVELYSRLNFGENRQIATNNAIQCGANLTQLMPTIGGRREVERRLVADVVQSKLLYTAVACASALNNHAFQKKLSLAQRGFTLGLVSSYRNSWFKYLLIFTFSFLAKFSAVTRINFPVTAALFYLGNELVNRNTFL